MDWTTVKNIDDVNQMAHLLKGTLLKAADRVICNTKIKDGDSSPWIDGEVIDLANKRKTKRRKAKHTGRE